jgi:putative stress-induced transcription regulator
LVSTEDLVLGFANTHCHLGRLPERFADSAGLRDWLSQQHGVDSTVLVVTAADVIEAREIRDALVTVMVNHADTGAASADDLLVAEQALQRAAQRYPLQANITRESAGLSSVQPGLAGIGDRAGAVRTMEPIQGVPQLPSQFRRSKPQCLSDLLPHKLQVPSGYARLPQPPTRQRRAVSLKPPYFSST